MQPFLGANYKMCVTVWHVQLDTIALGHYQKQMVRNTPRLTHGTHIKPSMTERVIGIARL